MTKTNIIQIKVTAEQTRIIREASQKVGLPMTTFIRYHVLNKILSEANQS